MAPHGWPRASRDDGGEHQRLLPSSDRPASGRPRSATDASECGSERRVGGRVRAPAARGAIPPRAQRPRPTRFARPAGRRRVYVDGSETVRPIHAIAESAQLSPRQASARGARWLSERESRANGTGGAPRSRSTARFEHAVRIPAAVPDRTRRGVAEMSGGPTRVVRAQAGRTICGMSRSSAYDVRETSSARAIRAWQHQERRYRYPRREQLHVPDTTPTDLSARRTTNRHAAHAVVEHLEQQPPTPAGTWPTVSGAGDVITPRGTGDPPVVEPRGRRPGCASGRRSVTMGDVARSPAGITTAGAALHRGAPRGLTAPTCRSRADEGGAPRHQRARPAPARCPAVRGPFEPALVERVAPADDVLTRGPRPRETQLAHRPLLRQPVR
jgi:hypothetical protein